VCQENENAHGRRVVFDPADDPSANRWHVLLSLSVPS
jgi:hypothetical protein